MLEDQVDGVASQVEEPTAPPAEPTGTEGTPEPTGADTAPATTATPDQGPVPYSRFAEVYKKQKDLERDNQVLLDLLRQAGTGQSQTPTQAQPAEPAIPDSFPDLPKPRVDQYQTYEEYIEAQSNYAAEVALRKDNLRRVSEFQQAQAMQKEQTQRSWTKKGIGMYPDFLEKVGSCPKTPEMADILLNSEMGHEMAYYLGNNPGLAYQIATLPPLMAALELGKIEASLKGPSPKTTTNAPNPTAPVVGKTSTEKDPANMTMAEFKAWRAAGGGGG